MNPPLSASALDYYLYLRSYYNYHSLFEYEIINPLGFICLYYDFLKYFGPAFGVFFACLVFLKALMF